MKHLVLKNVTGGSTPIENLLQNNFHKIVAYMDIHTTDIQWISSASSDNPILLFSKKKLNKGIIVQYLCLN